MTQTIRTTRKRIRMGASFRELRCQRRESSLMNANIRCITSAILVIASSATMAYGQVPNVITYQGELTDNECLAEGVYAMDFSIWTALEGGTEIYGVSIPDVTVTQGRFTVDLPVNSDTLLSSSRFLQITVEGVPLTPRERITSSAYSMQTRGLWVDENHNVGIHTATPDASLHVLGDAKLRGDVSIRDQLGVGDPSLLFGQLTVADSGSGAPFAIDAEWNNDSYATIFASNAGSGSVLYAQGSSDAEPEGGGLIVAGDEGGLNLAMDANEIMARDGTSTSALYLNNAGGDVVVGGTLHIGWEYISEIFKNEFGNGKLYCPAGKRPLGGGCRDANTVELVEASYPFCDEDGCGWSCGMDSTVGAEVHVICANVK